MSEAVNLHVQGAYRSKLHYSIEINCSAKPSFVEVFADLLATAPRHACVGAIHHEDGQNFVMQ